MFNPLDYAATVLDFDGTLADSMPYWGKSDCAILRSFGIEPDEAFMVRLIPLTERECSELFRQKGVRLTVDEIGERKHEYMRKAYGFEIDLKPGALDFLKYLKAHGRKVFVFSSTAKELLTLCIDRHGIGKYLTEVISASDLGLSKASAEAYHALAGIAGCETTGIAFYDDNPQAVLSAKEAGCFSIGVYDEYSRSVQQEVRKVADFYIESWPSFLSGIS